MQQPRTILKDPAELSIHPLAKSLPEWERDDERFLAMSRDIGERGVDQPLLIDRLGQVVDGRTRWRAAKLQQLTAVECRIVADNDIASTILGTLVHRRHLTKGALAYLAYPLLAPAHEEAKRRRLEKLRKGQQSPVSDSLRDGKSVVHLAASLNISQDLFQDAAKVHEIFAKDKDYKALMEPRIIAQPIGGEHEDKRPVGLGSVIAGYAGRGTLDKPRTDRQQLELFTDGLIKLQNRFSYWNKFDKAQLVLAKEEIRKTAKAMPETLRQEWKAALKEADEA